MTHDDASAQLVARLCAVDWTTALERVRSRARLVREYLRRAAWWGREVNGVEEWPFFDIAYHVDPTIRADPLLVQQLEEHLSAEMVWPEVKETCVWALHWAALRSAKPVQLPLDDPFEPLILMYERGGGFTSEHGFLQVGTAGVRLGTWEDHLKPDPVVALDPVALDELDERGSLRG